MIVLVIALKIEVKHLFIIITSVIVLVLKTEKKHNNGKN